MSEIVIDPDEYADGNALHLDKGIKPYVLVLRAAGIETYESCEGGNGHAFAEPTIRFHGGVGKGFHAYSVAVENSLPVKALRRTWDVIDGELIGATWELVFWGKA